MKIETARRSCSRTCFRLDPNSLSIPSGTKSRGTRETASSQLPPTGGFLSARGFTLIEVVISLVLFSILAAGLFSSAIQVRKWTEASVRESVSTAVATGFLEQLAATDFPNIINRIEDRTQPFPFVSRDGEPLVPAKSLRPMSESNWGEPIEVPLVNRLDEDGNEIDGPTMNFWFIPSVQRSTDTPNESVDIRIRYRWDDGQGRAINDMPIRSLFLVRTRIPN